MNIFRLAGDMSHVFSIIVLLLRLRVAKNAQGELGHSSAVLCMKFNTRCVESYVVFVAPPRYIRSNARVVSGGLRYALS